MISDRANKLHFSSIVVDAHCDSITRTMDHQEDLSNETFNGHLDLPRMKMGNVSCQFFSCLVHPKYIREDSPPTAADYQSLLNGKHSYYGIHRRSLQVTYDEYESAGHFVVDKVESRLKTVT